MARIVFALLLFGMAMTAIKIAIIVLVLAGLIFRTKETLSLLLVGGLLTLLGNYPMVGWPLLGLVIILGIVQACRGLPADHSSSAERLERLDRALKKHAREPK